MKVIVCEMCNASDFVKQDGVFVCQHCGCKYTVEEAKKMMIEGIVDVSGSTVKVDNTSFVQKYLENARRAKEKTDWEEVEKYYNMVEQNDPQNIEAIFYSAYGKVMLSLTESDRFKRKQKFDVFGKSISIIDDYFDPDRSDELIPLIEAMSDDLIRLTKSSYVFTATKNSNDSRYTEIMMIKVEQKFIESIKNIIEKDNNPKLYYILRCHYESLILNKTLGDNIREQYVQKLEECNKELKKIDPSYSPSSQAVEMFRKEQEKNRKDARDGWIMAIIWFAILFIGYLMEQ